MSSDLLSYDEKALASALSGLAVGARAAFAASCAYRLTAAAAGRGADMSLALGAIDKLRHFAESGTLMHADETETELIAAIQGEDEAPGFDASLVEDALASSAFALRCAAQGNLMDAVWAARRAYDAVDRYAGLRLCVDDQFVFIGGMIVGWRWACRSLTGRSRSVGGGRQEKNPTISIY